MERNETVFAVFKYFLCKKYIAYTMLYTNGNDLLDVIRHRITEFNEPKNK